MSRRKKIMMLNKVLHVSVCVCEYGETQILCCIRISCNYSSGYVTFWYIHRYCPFFCWRDREYALKHHRKKNNNISSVHDEGRFLLSEKNTYTIISRVGTDHNTKWLNISLCDVNSNALSFGTMRLLKTGEKKRTQEPEKSKNIAVERVGIGTIWIMRLSYKHIH